VVSLLLTRTDALHVPGGDHLAPSRPVMRVPDMQPVVTPPRPPITSSPSHLALDLQAVGVGEELLVLGRPGSG
jgi:hypothetical protein